MRKILIVIDMQVDFIEGSLGTPEARAIFPAVMDKVASYEPANIIFTRDTHEEDYRSTQEGKNLPVEHCIRGSKGWQIAAGLVRDIPSPIIFDKPTFGSTALAEAVAKMYEQAQGQLEVELVGLCTDICVVSNALLFKAACPEMKITVDSTCCAGTTPEKHEAALATMESCQIHIQ